MKKMRSAVDLFEQKTGDAERTDCQDFVADT
jgi:hypothetical protein